MHIYRDLDELPAFQNAVVTMGSFDGVHMGHREILAKIIGLADRYDGESVVITFDPHPRQVIYPEDNSLRLLSTTREKLEHLEQLGIHNTVVIPFTLEFSQQSAPEYVEKFLIERFHPKCLVVGYDHRFGANREGDFDLLGQYAEDGAFDLVQIEKQDIENVTVSSTKIRNALSAGEVDKANQLLGYTYSLRGTVVHGEKIGQTIGYPTANIQPENEIKLLPEDGIYAVYAVVHEQRWPAMLYIGARPTVEGIEPERRVEAHILDFQGDLYGKQIDIEFDSFIRKDKKLENLDELRKAISEDERAVRKALKLANKANPQPSALASIVALNYNGMNVMPKYFPSFEKHAGHAPVVIADNGSTDGSADWIAKEYPEWRLIRLTDNSGYAGGYNKALELVDSKYLALVNTDIELTEDWLEPLIDVLESNPGIGAVQPRIRAALERDKFEYAGAAGGYIDVFGYPFCAGRILGTVETDRGQYDRPAFIFWASGAAFVIRADLFRALGGFDGDYFAHMEEIDLCWRIQRAGYRIAYEPRSTVYHQGGATLPYESSRKVFLNFRNNLATLIKNESPARLLFVLPCRLVLDGLAAIHFLVRGQFKNAMAVLRGYLASTIWLPKLFRLRRKNKERIQRIAIGPEVFDGRYMGSLIWQYYFAGRKTFEQLKPNWRNG